MRKAHEGILWLATAWIAGGCSDDVETTASTSSTGGAAGTTAIASSASAGGGGAPSCEGTETSDPKLAAGMTLLHDMLAGHPAAGGAFVVVQHGQVLGLGVAGSKLATVCDPVTPDTLFHTGTGSALITNLAVLDAVDDGKLALDASITQYIPELHVENTTFGSADDIQLGQFLSRNSTYRAISDEWFVPGPCTTLVDSVTHADFPILYGVPGTMNVVYVLSDFEVPGLALERADGVPFPAAVRARVLDPLGMGGAYDLNSIVASGNFASANGDLPFACANRDPSFGYYGSVRDMGRLLGYITGGAGTILDQATRDTMLDPRGPGFWSSDFTTYLIDGYPTEEGDVLFYENNTSRGFSQALWIFQERELAIFAMLSTDGVNIGPMLPGLAAIYDPSLEGAVFDFPFPPTLADAQSLVGTYSDPIGYNGEGPRDLVVTLDTTDPNEAKLHAVVTGFGGFTSSYDLSGYNARDNYTTADGATSMRFWRDASDVPYAASFHADGGPTFYRAP